MTSRLLLLFGLVILRGSIFAQNPYESLGKVAPVLTLSEGKYQEFMSNDTVVQIGSVLFNRLTNEVVAFLDEDSLRIMEADMMTRFLSVDPIGRKFPELTPYQFASNTPIQAIDLDGLEGQFFFGSNTTKNAESQGQVFQKNTTGGEIIDGIIEGVKQLCHDLAPIRPADENDSKDLGESWEHIKQIPSNLWNTTSNLKKIYSEGTVKEKAKATVVTLGIAATFKKGGPKETMPGVVISAFGNWKSVKTFGHTFLTHGKNELKSLIGRLEKGNDTQGHWLDNEKAATFLKTLEEKIAEMPSNTAKSFDLPEGLGQLITKGVDGKPVYTPAPKVTIVKGPTDGNFIKTAFPSTVQ